MKIDPLLKNLQIYLVGGAVRDQLLGLPITERDWVVVGSNPEALLKLGFIPVGKDFPVFLHPKTKEEYALARTERKTAPGYQGFIFHADSTVTLEQDLRRRDLTMNAMAMTSDGDIIDPYQGQQDLQQKILRHVSNAFIEDPVRILRIARFMARFSGFTIANETQQLMQQMVQQGEIHALVAERVGQELIQALSAANPLAFFTTLQQCNALAILFPELINQTLNILAHNDPLLRFAYLVLALTPAQIKTLCQRCRLPQVYYRLAMYAQQAQTIFNATMTTPEAILTILNRIDVWRNPHYFKHLLNIFADYPQIENIIKAYQAAKQVDTRQWLNQGLIGSAYGQAIQQARLQNIINAFNV